MKYKIIVFKKGFFYKTYYVEAKSAKSAIKEYFEEKLLPGNHFLVLWKENQKRYNHKLKPIPSGNPLVFQFTGEEKKCVGILFNNTSEVFPTTAPKKLHTAFESAKTANPEKPLSAITACIEETFASKDFSTPQKTWSGSAPSVTEEPTPIAIDYASGTDKSAVLEKPTWNIGTNPFHSKSNTLFATVKRLPERNTDPGVNPKMKRLEGQTIEVHSKKNLKGCYIGVRVGWYWKPEWLDFDHIKAYGVKQRWGTEKHFCYIPSMDRLTGKLQNFRLDSYMGYLYYKGEDGWNWNKDWLSLEPPVKSAVLKAVIKPNNPEVQLYTECMREMVGQEVEVVETESGWYKDKTGYHWHKDSLIFEGERK